MKMDAAGAALLVIVFALVPGLALRTRRLLVTLPPDELPMSRPAFFWQSAFVQIVLYAVALIAAATNALVLRLLPLQPWRWWSAATLLGAAVVLLHVTWRHRSEADLQRLYSLVPQEPRERLPYFVLCGVAAVAEEVVYRGVAYRLLLRLGVAMPVAVVLLSLAFAAAHSIQGWRSAAAIALFAAGFHAVVIYTGALLPAIVAHFAYDAYAGLVIARLMRRR